MTHGMFKGLAASALVSLLMTGTVHAAPVDAETALRCGVPADAAIYARKSALLKPIVRGRTTIVRSGAQAPAVMVEGWRPAPGPLATVLSQLGSEAGFAVVGADGLGPVSWNRPDASLTDVLDALTAQAGATWSYSSGVVRVVRGVPTATTTASMPLPADRDAVLAVLDTLRGYDARDVALGADAISFSGSPAVVSKVDAGLRAVQEVHAFDVAFMEGRPSAGRYSYASMGVMPSTDASGGRLLLGEDGRERTAAFLTAQGDVRPATSQTVAGPSGWALVVPEAQCGGGKGEIVLRPKRVGDGFSLQVTGFGTPVTVPMISLGQTLVLAAKDPVGGWFRFVSIRPRILAVR